MAEDRNLPQLAYLGPLGTYSHQAAYDRFGESVKYCEKSTITDVFNALSIEVPIAVIPQENSIFGSVTETYDLLRLPEAGRDKFVKGEVSLAIQHCLLARRGVEIHEVKRILSHEQALGQCRQFIKKHLPNAVLENTSSTAAAAKAVVESDAKYAAICSKLCVTLFDGLEALREGIQDENVNTTRFYIITTSEATKLPPPPRKLPRRALVHISYQPTGGPAANVNITQLLVALELPVLRVDRRPSLYPVIFHDVYFVELQQEEYSQSVDDDEIWLEEVKKAIQRVKLTGGEARLLGTWES